MLNKKLGNGVDMRDSGNALVAAIVLILVVAGIVFAVTSMKKDKGAEDSTGSEVAAKTESETGENTGETAATTGEEEKAESAESKAKTANASEVAETPAENTYDGVKVKPGNPVVAKVNGKDITRVDVYRYIKAMPASIQQLPPSTVYPMALERVIDTAVVQSKVDKADIGNDEEVKKQLEIAKEQIMRSVYLQREVDKLVSDADVKKAYDEYVKKLPDVEQRRARHILLKTEEEAKQVIKEIENGADFAEVAKSKSTGPTKSSGGDLGWFAKGDMVPGFADAVFAMKKGDVSKKPVKTQFGWHVIKMEDKRMMPKPSFEEVAPVLRSQMQQEKLEELVSKWRKEAKIEKFDVNGDPIKKAPKKDNKKK